MRALDPPVARDLLHRRTVEIEGYKRADGLYDVEAHLVDVKPFDMKLASGLRGAGDPIHSMWLRITIDRNLVIVDAQAAMDGMPYVDHCGAIVPAYRRLVGIAIRPGYMQKLKELFGGVRGCTHVTELAAALATAAFQTLAGQKVQDPAKKPFQLDRCHALDATGAVVGKYYPRWYRGTEPVEPAEEADEH